MTEIFYLKKGGKTKRKTNDSHVGAKRLLWHQLKQNQLGFRFCRQCKIGAFVVDFFCPQLKLAIEIDGNVYPTVEEIKRGKARLDYLERSGLIVKRFLHSDIHKNLDNVVNHIRELCMRYNTRIG